MNKGRLRNSVLMNAAGFVLINAAYAGTAVWTFAQVSGYPSSVTVSTIGTATIKYTVTNQSHKSHALMIKPIQGIISSGCTSPLGYHQSCTLTLAVNGSELNGDVVGGPVLCDQANPNQCYQPNQENSLAIRLLTQKASPVLTTSVSTLTLSIKCQPSSSCSTTQNIALTGNSRQITIQNTGSTSATNVSVSATGLPIGTSISNNCTSTLSAGDSCIITLTPDSIANSDSNGAACTSGTQPVASTVTVTADGGLSSKVNTYILGYGCQYQGGFLYSVDDNYTDYPETGSIGGKVAALVDQAEPYIQSGPQATSIIWSTNGSGTTSSDVSYDKLPGIDETSTSSSASPTFSTFQSFFSSTYTNTDPFTNASFSSCQGNSDGQCNASNILTFYNEFITNYNSLGSPLFTASNGPTPLTDYAEGLCKQPIGNYSDWYLPAICEIDAVNTNITCPSGTQSMLSSLSFLLGNPGAGTPSISCSPPSGTSCLAGYYWSSTELSISPQLYALSEYFSSGGSNQSGNNKGGTYGVRCSRHLTP